MVAPNTQLSPLQHHSKSLSTLTSSWKNYSRIQSEVEREGFEVHKENLLSLPLSRKNSHSGAGEPLGESVPSSSQTGPLHTYRKAPLQSMLPAVLGTMSHGHTAQSHEQGAAHMELMLSCGKTRLLAPDTSQHLPGRAASPSFSGLHPPVVGEEAQNAYKLYAEMFPQVYTPSMSACLATSLRSNQEFNLVPCTSEVEHVEVGNSLSNVGSVEAEAGDEVGNMKRLKYALIGEDGTSMRLLGYRNSEQGFVSCGGLDGSNVSSAEDAASNACVNDAGVFDWEAKSRGCVATLCRTSITPEISEAPGLKLFTTSIHVQMPKSLSTFSEGEPFLPLSLDQLQQQGSSQLQKTPMYEGSCADADWGKFLALSATPKADDSTAVPKVLPFQQRFKQLQAFLKQCDEADQMECMHAIRSLSAAARSAHAVELETRAIRLSLEEGKEIKRMRLLNVLGKISERSMEDAGATPQGPRLPAPGVAVKFMNVPPQ